MLSKAMVVTGTPMSIVEHPLWKEFFNNVAPNYNLPSRKTIATSYLDKIYKEMHDEVNADLQESTALHLQCDGWTNIKHQGIINFLISKPEPVFVKFVNTEGNRHTADYIATEIVQVLSTYGEHKFFVLVGDNAANIQRAFLNVKDQYPHIIPLRCVAHTLNLVCHDIMKIPSIKPILEMAANVIKEIKNSHVLVALFEKISKEKQCTVKLKLLCKTRWGSVYDMFQRLKQTKSALQALAVHERAHLSREIQQHLLDYSFWDYISQTAALIEPVAVNLNKLQGNECLIHKVHSSFSDIKRVFVSTFQLTNVLSKDEETALMQKFEERTAACIKPIHLAANLLDPSSRGINLEANEDVLAMEFIEELSRYLDVDVMSELSDFKSKQGLWARNFVWASTSKVSPLSWWTGLCRSTKLSKIAAVIFTAPITSAATERSFSTFSHIHNKKRNSLDTDRAGKMTFVSYNWNLLHKSETNKENKEIDTGIGDEQMSREEESTDEDHEFEDGPSTSGLHNPSLTNFSFIDCERSDTSDSD